MVIGLAFSAACSRADPDPHYVIGPATVTLQAGEVVRTAHLEALRLICLRGRVWVTQEGDSRDYVVGEGGSMPLRAGVLVVIEAMQDSEVRFSPAPFVAPRRAG